MEVIFLGTNGWYDTETGNTVCILVKSENHAIIFDAGNGFYKLDAHLSDRGGRTGYLFLSHFHLDHVEGLHMLNKVKSLDRLVIAGPEGTRAMLDTLVNSPFTIPLVKLSYQVDTLEMPAERNKIPFSVEALALLHADLTLGYRLEIDGKVVAYCPDTGYCENAVKLARNSDLLIAECAYRSGETDPDRPHLNPESAARIANDAGAKMLAQVHFDASRYSTILDRRIMEKHPQKLFSNSFAANDSMTVTL